MEVFQTVGSGSDRSELGSAPRVEVWNTANLPTEFGEFKIVNFTVNGEEVDDVAIISGSVMGGEEVLTRIHSECLTGDALGSLRCDCRAQLHASLRSIADSDSGIVLYLRQEGRGIGLFKKVAAYALQDGGLDTVDANLALGMPDDCREFDVAAGMLRALGVHSVRLLTNNPRKVNQLLNHGLPVSERVAHSMQPNEHNLHYLKTKASRSGHLLKFSTPKKRA